MAHTFESGSGRINGKLSKIHVEIVDELSMFVEIYEVRVLNCLGCGVLVKESSVSTAEPG
ncbi:MAG: hypothetical protein INQ03_09370 [Candidatus Heimdallarchaeota archaeon]|nr:hypothetical protein [Candidatus Heimdallarchaeota archaeon]